jgi:hypothetical protein
MPDRFNIELLGLPALEARLRAAPAMVERTVVHEALHDGANAVRGIARATIKSRTGRLAATMNVKPNQPKLGRLGWSVWTGTSAQLGLGNAKWYYPMHLHAGHALPYQGPLSIGRRRSRRLRLSGARRVAARPFLRNALTYNRAYIFQVIASGVSRRLSNLGF